MLAAQPAWQLIWIKPCLYTAVIMAEISRVTRMSLDHLVERRYCPLHPELVQPDEDQCMKCGVPLLVDRSLSGALRQAVQLPGMLYVMIAVMCALIVALALLAR